MSPSAWSWARWRGGTYVYEHDRIARGGRGSIPRAIVWLVLALAAALWPAAARADTCIDRFRNSGSLSKEALNDPDCGIASGVGAGIEAGGAALTAIFIIQGALAASRLVGGGAGGLGGAGGAAAGAVAGGPQ